MAMVVSYAYLVLYVEDPFNPSPRGPLCDCDSEVPQYLIFFFLIYNITDCVFYYDVAFLALHVKFRYLVSSLALRDCLYPINLFGLLTDLTDVKILS